MLLKNVTVPLETAASPGQDNPAGLIRPIDVALDATGLGSALGPDDQLLLFNNAQAGFNKSASATYYFDTQWRLLGDSTSSDRGGDLIPQGAGFIIRRIGGDTALWTNSFPVAALSAVSRKLHGGVPFDVPLPLSGTPGVECRSGGSTKSFQAVITFPSAVTFSAASVTSGTANVTSASGSGTTVVTMNFTSGSNAQYVTLTLANVNDGMNTNDIAVRIGLLVGDTNGNRSVNSADIAQTKSKSGQAITSSNFREDLTADGGINSADIGLVKSKSGTFLPPP